MMAKNPKQRYQTPAEVAFELERFTTATAVARAPKSRSLAGTADHKRTVVLETTPVRGRRRRRFVIVTAIPLIVVTGLLALVLSGVFHPDEWKSDSLAQDFASAAQDYSSAKLAKQEAEQNYASAKLAKQEFPSLTGLAAKGHWAVGNGTATPLEDGSIRLETKELALWEIPWDHRAERFRLQVEVEDLASATKGVGVYFGYAKQVTPKRTEHWFYEYCFAERSTDHPRPETRRGQAQAQVFARRYGTGLIDHTVDPFIRQCTWGFPPQRGTGRLLTVKFTPELVSAHWDTASLPFTHITRVYFNRNGDVLAEGEPRQKNTPSHFHPLQGSLGLLCENGSAEFRRLTIEPLSDAEAATLAGIEAQRFEQEK
jgi:hypothetical protein